MNSQRQKMKQQQKLTPQQLLLMRLLQLPVTALEQRIKEEMENNPMLEIHGSNPINGDEAAEEPITVGDTDGADMEDGMDRSDFKDTDSDDFYEDDDYGYRERLERDRNVEEHRLDPSEGTSFTESLLRQIRLRNLTERQRAICEEIIGSIDGSGYLGRDIQMIANDLAFRSGIDADDSEMESMLSEVQNCEPAGVGARSLQECLTLQLHRIENPDDDTLLAMTIVEDHFSQLSSKHYSTLMMALKISESSLKRALQVIRRLNPKPGWGRGEEDKGAQYITPDFIVSNDGGVLSLSLNTRNNPKLLISTEYSGMLHELSAKTKLSGQEQSTLQFIRSKNDEAQWLIDTLKQREQTMSATMSAIMEWQAPYFRSGDSVDLVPMRLKDIAEKTGYDESTISRVVNNKFVQTDFGTLPLKELFAKAVVTEQGDMMATNHIKEALRKAIDEEDKSAPLTDEALCKVLHERGYKLSRRTITKYRESMGIPVGRMRKELDS